MDTAEAFLQHQQWLWAVVYARLGNRSDTDDVLQEISVAAVQFDLRAQEIQNIKGWLYQVAVRQVMLFRRREGRYRRRLKTFAELQPEHATSLPWSATQDAWENDLERVRAAMTRIRPSDRQVLVLKYKNGLRCREIAMHMGVKESTIQSRLLRARRRLRALLVNHETDGKERANG